MEQPLVQSCRTVDEILKPPRPLPQVTEESPVKPTYCLFDPEIDEWGHQLEED